ncbi:MAG TPA: YIEGIA domain-containing protein [Bacillota bacterium]
MEGPALWAFAAGSAAGFLLRLLVLRVDYRQYPSYPHNYVAHLTVGLIAAVIGAMFTPALLAGEYAAVTFLTLAATQFREVRSVERETLRNLERSLLIVRGPDYIEGISAVFEARNYLAMATALGTTTVAMAADRLGGRALFWPATAAAAAVAVTLGLRLRSGGCVGDVADVHPARLRFEGPNLYVDQIYIMNVGSAEAREQVLRWGRAYRLVARNEGGAAKLAHPGQRQAVLHDVTAVLGSRKDIAMPELTPMIRQDVETGELGVYVTPAVGDDRAVMAVIRRVPLLEAARGSDPEAFGVGRSRREE